MDLKLQNKVVVITGGTGGIGKQICLDFLNENAIVICLIRNKDKFNQLKTWFDSNHVSTRNLFAYECDLLNQKNIIETVKKIQTIHTRIDILVNCAGTVIEMPFAMLDEASVDKMLDTNLKAIMLLTQAVLKPMFAQSEGAIVNISSITAQRGGRGVVAYASAKAGLDSFTRTLAIEIGRKKIRINGVRPGAIETTMSEPLQARAQKHIQDAMILGRFGKPEEVSKGVLFLASNETASYITGTFLNIDGGYFV